MATMYERDTRDTAAMAIANGMTVRETAEQLQIGERTLHRWANNDPEFIAAIAHERARRRMRLEELVDAALERAHRLADDPNVPEYVQRQHNSDLLLFYERERERDLSEEDAAVDRALRERGILP